MLEPEPESLLLDDRLFGNPHTGIELLKPEGVMFAHDCGYAYDA